jgi:predicted ArsR family transcriptional regulator
METQTIVGKAMGNPVRLKILEELSQHPLTLEDLSKSINLKSESIYHHVRILQQVGLVEEFDPVRSGGPGRPYTRFRLTGNTVKIQYPPRDYYLLSEIMIKHLSDLFDEQDLQKKLESVGISIGEEIAKDLSSLRKVDDWTMNQVKEHYIESYLRDTGHQPEVVESSENSITYRTFNCLFSELSKKYPDTVCAIDKGAAEGLFSTLLPNSETKRTSCMGKGDEFCEYCASTK